MRLLLFNLVTDADDPVLGFGTRWVRAIARRVESVDIVTMSRGVIDVPDNVRVHSVGKELGYSESRRAVRFYRLLRQILAERRIDACFSHMMPLFSVMAAPVLRPRGIPIVTWYTHRQLSHVLRLAYAASTQVVTASADSWPYLRGKLSVIGHGIDEHLFTPTDIEDDVPLVVSVGRISPIKRVDVLVEAARALAGRGMNVRWALVGQVPERDRAYADALRKRIRALGLDDVFRLVGAVPYAEVAAWHRRATCHVSLSPQGLFDKAVLESMACGRPGLVAHGGYDELLGPLAPTLRVDDVSGPRVATAIARVLLASRDERREIGAQLRQRAMALHGLEGLADRLIAILGRAAGASSGRIAA